MGNVVKLLTLRPSISGQCGQTVDLIGSKKWAMFVYNVDLGAINKWAMWSNYRPQGQQKKFNVCLKCLGGSKSGQYSLLGQQGQYYCYVWAKI